MARSETGSAGCAIADAAMSNDSAAKQRTAREETVVMGWTSVSEV